MTIKLTLSDLPEDDDLKAIIAFANRFNSYRRYGSFNAAVAALDNSKRASLDDVLNELFMYYRAVNHHGDTKAVVDKYRELLPCLRKLIAAQG